MEINYIRNFVEKYSGSILVSLIGFVGIFLWNVFSKDLFNTYIVGYLSFFGIYSFYKIKNPLTSISFFIFALYFIIILSSVVVPYLLKKVHNKPRSQSKRDNLAYYLSHILVYIFINFILSALLYIFCIKQSAKTSAFESMRSFLSDGWMFMLGMIFLLTYIEAGLDFSNLILSFKISGLKSKKAIYLLLINLILILPCSALVIDEFGFSLGKVTPSIQYVFPSFVKNNIEYIVIGEMEKTGYLTIDVSSLEDSNLDTICIIQDISDVRLIDKNISFSYSE